ncbi:DUF3419 family protein [Actinocatenispora rupis]|uniref:S-adenosylmethionine:diacylglycerol 3-amino-3-carboxypropyl transferase n=1 Tax=Actinocatenispora rupis TaxID=519421 RepID=A0A8J3J4G2_9ACTN|nr:DUF3419 family protein [Actinocatenispora rupis]GID09954.1 hypothetical protein Aru02nite_08430 [Actinocatenispora rupis]
MIGDTAWRAGWLTAGRGARLLFGRTYEDPAVELAAFGAPCRVLAVASAGDTAAALAAAGHRVTAIDINPVQLRYAERRLAGAAPRDGQAERLLAAGRTVLRTLAPEWRPARLAPFLRLRDPDRQVAWWDGRLDGTALRLALRPLRLAAPVVRPALAAALPPRFDDVLRDRLRDTLSRHPNADNTWLRRLLLGPGTAPLIAPVDRFVPGDLVAHLAAGPPDRYDAVALSNIADGAGVHFGQRLADALRHGVRRGGRVVLRSFGTTVPLPADLGWRDVTGSERCPLWGVVSVGEVR